MTIAPLARSAGRHDDWTYIKGRLSPSVIEAFVGSDWSFAGTQTRDNIHPYPARYVLDLPTQVIRLFQPKLGVIDPFCGSGTTLEASAIAGLAASGIDLNPIACLISRVRVTPWAAEDDLVAAEHERRLLDAAAHVDDATVVERSGRIPRVDHWFEPWAQRLLAGATAYLDEVRRDDPWHDRLALSISSAIVKLSRQDSDTRYAAIEKNGSTTSGLVVLRRAVRRTAEVLRQRTWTLQAPAVVYQTDARDLSLVPARSHDLAIFSPPYPNAYEYWLYHKYRMYWLEHDPVAVRESEMGARPHYFKTNGHTEVDFANQMRDVFAELAGTLKPHSAVVIVVGDSLIHGRVIDNRELLFDCAADVGYTPRAATVRPIARRRSSFNGAHGAGRDVEHILLLESPA